VSHSKLGHLDAKVYGETYKFQGVDSMEILVDLVEGHRFLILKLLPTIEVENFLKYTLSVFENGIN
jgi:hypothetical protein